MTDKPQDENQGPDSYGRVLNLMKFLGTSEDIQPGPYFESPSTIGFAKRQPLDIDHPQTNTLWAVSISPETTERFLKHLRAEDLVPVSRVVTYLRRQGLHVKFYMDAKNGPGEYDPRSDTIELIVNGPAASKAAAYEGFFRDGPGSFYTRNPIGEDFGVWEVSDLLPSRVEPTDTALLLRAGGTPIKVGFTLDLLTQYKLDLSDLLAQSTAYTKFKKNL